MESFEVLEERPNGLAAAIRLAWVSACILLVAVMGLQLVSEGELAALAAVWTIGSVVGLTVVRRRAGLAKHVSALVGIDASGITVDRELVARREEIELGALLSAPDGGCRVVFRRRWS